MKQRFLILFLLCTLAVNIMGQQIVFGGKKYDYKFAFSSYKEIINNEFIDVNSPLTIFLSRNGDVAVGINGKKVCEITFCAAEIENSINYNNYLLLPDPYDVTNITSSKNKSFFLQFQEYSRIELLYRDESQELKHLYIPFLSTAQIHMVENIYKLVSQKKFFRLSKLPAGASRKLMTGEDGRQWYLVQKGKLYGAQDEGGVTIVPCEYDTVIYEYKTGNWKYKNGGYLGRYENRYYIAKKNNCSAAYTVFGTCVVPIERGYEIVWIPSHSFYQKKISWYFQKNRTCAGLLDAHGNEVIPPTEVPELEGYWMTDFYFYLASTDHYVNEPEHIFATVEYGALKGGKELKYTGLYDIDGNCIVPLGECQGGISVLEDHISVYPDRNREIIKRIDIALPNNSSTYNYNPFEELLTIIYKSYSKSEK